MDVTRPGSEADANGRRARAWLALLSACQWAELGASFDAPPGEYQFVCAIPGHVEAGMVGTLTVESCR